MKSRHIVLCLGLAFASIVLPLAAQRSPDTRIDTDAAASAVSRDPRIATAGDSVYATWVDERNGSSFVFSDIYFNRSLDRGVSWLASDIRLNTGVAGASGARSPRIAAVGSNVYVVWHDARSGKNGIYLNRSTDAGATWLPADVKLNNGTANAQSPEIAVVGSTLYAVWEDTGIGSSFTSDVFFNRSVDGGITWLPAEVRLNTNPAGSSKMDLPLILAEGSMLYVVWEDHRAPSARTDITWSGKITARRRRAPTSSSTARPTAATPGCNRMCAWTPTRRATRTPPGPASRPPARSSS